MLNKNPKGYVLIDVLIAVTILSIGLVLFSRVIIMPIKGANSATKYTKAQWLLNEKLDEYRLGFIGSEQKDKIEFAEDEFNGSLEVINSSDFGDIVKIYVSWQEGNDLKAIEFETPVISQGLQ